ncbi:MAG TPA: gliding motility-associated C-terminal domain-containing protein [Ohtaekwangia sp.]
MKKIVLIVFLLLTPWLSKATHIVGGEFEFLFRNINPSNGFYRYNLSLILYFDNREGNPAAKDGFVDIRIYRRRDNAIMETIRLDSMVSTNVKYFQPKCSSGLSISTRRMYYTYKVGNQQSLYSLNPNLYTDPQGYYIVWERCCRNYNITNAFSENPDIGGVYAGQTFYLEFPPLIKNGEQFINSSPSLFPPLSDYACPGRLYYVDFAGTDADGDSLVYTIVTPYNTKTQDALPPGGFPRPLPYPEIAWRSPFSATNIMGGNPDLKISTDGLLTVVPSFAGLYVFAVKCAEYRDGIKIGEIRRDFQMVVRDECPVAEEPVIEAKPIDAPDTEFTQGELGVSFSNSTTDDKRCVVIRVTDPDSQKPDQGNEEFVAIRAIPLGFKDSHVEDIIPDIDSATLVNGSAAEFTVCFPQCPYILGPYRIGIISQDNACPLPLLDTIVIEVNVELPPNNLPQFDAELLQATELERQDPQFALFNIGGSDSDPDSLVITQVPSKDFDMADYGFEYDVTNNVDGRIDAVLSWNVRCDEVDFSDRTNFPLMFLLDDEDECDLLPPDTMRLDLNIDLFDFNDPVIEYVPDPGLEKVELTRKIYETLTFPVRGTDVDGDHLNLTAQGIGFSMTNYGMTFPDAEGFSEVTSPYTWAILCDKVNLNLKNEFDLEFIVIDSSNRCHYYLADTLHVTVTVEPPDNEIPILTANGVEEELEVTSVVDDPVSINLLGTDADRNPTDLLKLELIEDNDNPLPEGVTFEPAQGLGSVQSVLQWTPTCEIYQNKVFENDYTFNFRVTDSRCITAGEDEVTVKLKIKDKDRGDAEFLPPNIVTPNRDQWNQYFAMVKRDPTSGELVSILPNDNCAGQFVSILVYNRWGRQVYYSSDRDFKWAPVNESTGVYYYTLQFSDHEYKGLITVANDQ